MRFRILSSSLRLAMLVLAWVGIGVVPPSALADDNPMTPLPCPIDQQLWKARRMNPSLGTGSLYPSLVTTKDLSGNLIETVALQDNSHYVIVGEETERTKVEVSDPQSATTLGALRPPTAPGVSSPESRLLGTPSGVRQKRIDVRSSTLNAAWGIGHGIELGAYLPIVELDDRPPDHRSAPGQPDRGRRSGLGDPLVRGSWRFLGVEKKPMTFGARRRWFIAMSVAAQARIPASKKDDDYISTGRWSGSTQLSVGFTVGEKLPFSFRPAVGVSRSVASHWGAGGGVDLDWIVGGDKSISDRLMAAKYRSHSLNSIWSLHLTGGVDMWHEGSTVNGVPDAEYQQYYAGLLLRVTPRFAVAGQYEWNRRSVNIEGLNVRNGISLRVRYRPAGPPKRS